MILDRLFLHDFCAAIGAIVILLAGVTIAWRLTAWLLEATGTTRRFQERRARRRALEQLLSDVRRRHPMLIRK